MILVFISYQDETSSEDASTTLYIFLFFIITQISLCLLSCRNHYRHDSIFQLYLHKSQSLCNELNTKAQGAFRAESLRERRVDRFVHRGHVRGRITFVRSILIVFAHYQEPQSEPHSHNLFFQAISNFASHLFPSSLLSNSRRREIQVRDSPERR